MAVIVDTANPHATTAKLDHWDDVLNLEYAGYISEAFTLALEAVLTDPSQKIGDVNLVSRRMMDQIVSFNSPEPAPRVECLHEIFRQRAHETPSAAAVFSTEMSLTYSQLDLLSNRLSNHLINLGVGPEAKVVMCFEKSAWTIVSMIAIWKAGGCAIALDPAQPKARINTITDEVDARLVLTSPQTASLWDRNPGLTAIVVDKKAIMESMTNEEAPVTSVRPCNAAYINFTSGTTGKPKGAIIEHVTFSSNLDPLTRASSVDSGTRALQFCSYAFDGFYWETILPLLSGGCICIANDYERSNDLVGFISKANCNWACLTPSFSRLLRPSDVPTLKVLLLIGEAMSAGDILTWSKSVILKNGYGPCECTPGSTVNPDLGSDGRVRNVGWRLGQTLWVVDPNNHERLAPVGAVGELLLGGLPVGRGYVNQPERTHEAFLESPKWLARLQQAGRSRPLRPQLDSTAPEI